MGNVLSVYGVLLTVKFQGHSDFIQYIFDMSDFHQPYILKTSGRRAKETKSWGSGTCALRIWVL